jgi:hypothetical protein
VTVYVLFRHLTLFFQQRNGFNDDACVFRIVFRKGSLAYFPLGEQGNVLLTKSVIDFRGRTRTIIYIYIYIFHSLMNISCCTFLFSSALTIAKDFEGMEEALVRKISKDKYMFYAVRECYQSLEYVLEILIVGSQEKR